MALSWTYGQCMAECLQSALDEHERQVEELKLQHAEEIAVLQNKIAALSGDKEIAVLQNKIAALSGDKVHISDSCERYNHQAAEAITPQHDRDSIPDRASDGDAHRDYHGKTAAKTRTFLKLRDKEVEQQHSWLRKFIDGPFDRITCIIIALNTIFVFVDLELNGLRIAVEQNLISTHSTNQTTQDMIFVIEHIFCAFFLVELCLRVFVLKKAFLINDVNCSIEALNIFDVFLVLGTSTSLYLESSSANLGGLNFNIFRPLRFLRLARMLRVVQSMKFFSKLKVLLATVGCSLLALFWSIILLFATLLMAALFLNQILVFTLEDDSKSHDIKMWIYRYYGTSTRSFYTVFELTFSGGWPNYARPLVEDVSPLWSLFFFGYIVIVVFAMFRIITALFLRDTLALAADDAEMQIQDKMKLQQGVAEKLEAFFREADTSGDGLMNVEEFRVMLEDPKVVTWLSLLELEVRDALSVFSLLSQEQEDENGVSAEQFVNGMMRIKGMAKAADVFAIMHVGNKTLKDMERLKESIGRIERNTGSRRQHDGLRLRQQASRASRQSGLVGSI